MRTVKTSKEFKIDRKQRMHKCDRCPNNRGENVKRTPKRSWKLKTKNKRQYEPKTTVRRGKRKGSVE